MFKKSSLLLLAACAALGAIQAPALAQPYGPPPPYAERVPPPPGAHFGWVAGHWRWNGARWVWVPGHYARRPYGSHWVPGHYARGPYGGWRWVEGHWS